MPIVVDRVLLDLQGIVGELRRPKLVLAYGVPVEQIEYLATAPRYITNKWKSRPDVRPCCTTEEGLAALLRQYARAPTFTLHVENGIRYSFDVDKVMFCSGNTTERMHFAAVDATGETVVDMFCGIGYFALPLAVHGRPAALHALEKNPDSVAFLTLNAVQNKVAHLIHPQCGDNREIGNELVGTCDRVLMGYIPSCKAFLRRAVSFLKHTDAHQPVGVVHYHFLADKMDGRRVAQQHLAEELGAEVSERAELSQLRCVKSYAPKQFHFVADVVFH
ncbi:tRNA wybutosine-synthesizing protein 2 [Strigomonas culicis]|nr:tRNA wybutosine-synthesizing protein 2 [Strigomonas culicis]|eukprot:EPY32669.1 tRNA wybutosine-synthesizing protein 2 [Strigomonas culicis]